MQNIFLNIYIFFCKLFDGEFINNNIMMENLDYKTENIERKYSKNMWNNQFLKVKNSLLELEKDFMELTDRELKDREEKIKRELE